MIPGPGDILARRARIASRTFRTIFSSPFIEDQEHGCPTTQFAMTHKPVFE
jgi:hypothetical protein